MKDLKEIRITVDNVSEELPKLIHSLMPDWNKDKIELKKLSGGYSCLMYHCFETDNPLEGVTVRAKNNTSADVPLIKDCAEEAKILGAMHRKGLFPEVLAIFENGFCYKYIEGKPIYRFGEEMKLEESLMRVMARKLAEIHSVKVEGLDYSTPTFFGSVYELLEKKYPVDNLPLGAPTRDVLYRELQLVEKYVLQTGSQIVLCHGDVHPGNMVYNIDTGLVTYVDWECSHIGYQGSDLGSTLQVLSSLNIEIPEGYVRKYLRYYLEKWFDIQGKKESDVTEEDIDKLEMQTSIFRLSTLLMWVSLTMVFFAVNKPKYITEEDMDKLQNALREDMPKPSSNSSEDTGAQMAINVFKTYSEMKDDILANFKIL